MEFLRRFQKPSWLYPALFMAKIVLFSLFYWAVFWVTPDAFRFGEGYNVNPLSTFGASFYESDDPSAVATGDVGDDLAEMQSLARDAEAAFVLWDAALSHLNAKELEYDALLKAIDQALESSYEQFQVETIEPLERRIELTRDYIKSADSSDPDLSNFRLELRRMEAELVEHYDFLVEDRTGFVSAQLIAQETALRRELSAALETAEMRGAAHRDLRSAMSETFGSTRSTILSKIGLPDFIYFSACISTTTTFGDITANKPWLRLVVALQIVLGIFILAKMLEAFARKD